MTEPAADIEVVMERSADAYGFMVKVVGSGMLFRVAPARDPRQPRFWCVMVYRCSSGVLADKSEVPWYDHGGHRREDLRDVMQVIRENPDAWLRAEPNRELRDWMLAPRESPAAAPQHRRLSQSSISPA
ncbi:MAG: hypothetical protein U0031_00665 [Thermomicrobiales bacterium]